MQVTDPYIYDLNSCQPPEICLRADSLTYQKPVYHYNSAPNFNIFSSNIKPFQFNNNSLFNNNLMFNDVQFSNNDNYMFHWQSLMNYNYRNLVRFINSTSTQQTSVQTDDFVDSSYKGPFDMAWWKAHGYNEEKGSLLANAARRKYNGLSANERAQGNCVGVVRQVINDVNRTDYPKFGQARNIGKEYLCNDPNFKKIVVDMSKLKASDIPPGAIVLYPSGYANGPLSYCGHGEIAGGDGFGYSDVKTTLLSNHRQRRTPCEIWIPV